MVAQVVGQAGQGGAVAVIPGGGGITHHIDIGGHPYAGAQRGAAFRRDRYPGSQAQLRGAQAQARGRERGHGGRALAAQPVGAQLQVRGGGMVAHLVGQRAQAGQRGAVAVILGGGGETHYIGMAGQAQPAAFGEGHALRQAQLRRAQAGAGGRKGGHGGGPEAGQLVGAQLQVGGDGVVAQVVPADGEAGQARTVAVIFNGGGITHYINVARHPQPSSQGRVALGS